MKSQIKTHYPSARTSGILEVFKLIQEEVNWKPNSISVATLKTLGIAPSKETTVIHCLKFLGILDNVGKPTDIFSQLRHNFQPVLKETVLKSYQEIFDQIPVSRINQQTLVNFFGEIGYKEDTAEYQGALFVYLCKTAEIDLPNAPESFVRARFRKNK
jgi:hypothetical protein